MQYIVLFVAVISLFAITALLDPTHRRQARIMDHTSKPATSALAANIAEIAAEMARRFGLKNGPLLRVPADALHGARKEEQPCLTPIDCVMNKRCDGHCGCS